MKQIVQSPNDPGFIQNPYPFYERARALGPLTYWEDYELCVTTSYELTNKILRDRRFGRAPLEAPVIPDRLKPFYDIEAHSMLELEGEKHARLRRLVLKAFTPRTIAALEPQIEALAADLLRSLPGTRVDLLEHYCRPLPVLTIARLLGVPDGMAGDLLSWSRAMVAMYQAGRTLQDEAEAVRASEAFSDYLAGLIAQKRQGRGTDLISTLVAVSETQDALSREELISTAILLLNAGHEATVHAMGNAIRHCLLTGDRPAAEPERFVEECLRIDPPLHLFTRYVYEPLELAGQRFKRGDQIGLLLGAAGRDPLVFDAPERFDPTRPATPHLAFGAGNHFCLGAALARLELKIALCHLFDKYPALDLAEMPSYADIYHFRGLASLRVTLNESSLRDRR